MYVAAYAPEAGETLGAINARYPDVPLAAALRTFTYTDERGEQATDTFVDAALFHDAVPVRVNLIAPGFVDTPLSASLLGDDLEARRAQLRATLPIGRVVGQADVAALAVHIMTNTALTGATCDIDGGQQLIRGA